MIRTILIISFFVTGWQAQAKNTTKIASHPVHHEFTKIQNKKKTGKNICIIKTKKQEP